MATVRTTPTSAWTHTTPSTTNGITYMQATTSQTVSGNWQTDQHGHPMVLSTPVLLLFAQEQNGWYMHQAWQSQHDIGHAGALEFCPPQVNGNGRFSQPAPCYNSGYNIINALEGYTSWQVLMQMAMNLIQEFDGTNWEATIPWLDHIEAIAKKTGFNPLGIGMSKLKGMAVCNINVASKEGTLLYFLVSSAAHRAQLKHSICMRHPQCICPHNAWWKWINCTVLDKD